MKSIVLFSLNGRQAEGVFPVFPGRHAHAALEHFVESSGGAEADLCRYGFDGQVHVGVAQQADGFIDAVMVDVLGECLAGLFVDDLRQISAVGVERFGHLFQGQEIVMVDGLLHHAQFQPLEEIVLLFIAQ